LQARLRFHLSLLCRTWRGHARVVSDQLLEIPHRCDQLRELAAMPFPPIPNPPQYPTCAEPGRQKLWQVHRSADFRSKDGQALDAHRKLCFSLWKQTDEITSSSRAPHHRGGLWKICSRLDSISPRMFRPRGALPQQQQLWYRGAARETMRDTYTC
jgi:hypothetical protein